MYNYKFVKIDVEYNAFATKEKTAQDYHQIIHQHAREGWRLVQIFAPPIQGQGLADFYELIFERESSD